MSEHVAITRVVGHRMRKAGRYLNQCIGQGIIDVFEPAPEAAGLDVRTHLQDVSLRCEQDLFAPVGLVDRGHAERHQHVHRDHTEENIGVQDR